jgi:hypothetical protein
VIQTLSAANIKRENVQFADKYLSIPNAKAGHKRVQFKQVFLYLKLAIKPLRDREVKSQQNPSHFLYITALNI